MRSFDVSVDVGDRLGFADPQAMVATIYLPDAPAPQAVIFAAPGGSYSRHYFDLSFPGHAGYSQAEHHAAQGFIMITVDPLGCGDSLVGDLAAQTIDQMIEAQDEVVRRLYRDLEEGRLADGLPPLPGLPCIGIGQSMGGAITILMQGRHATFNAIATLGFSATWSESPERPDGTDNKVSVLGAGSDAITEKMRWIFHFEDVPEDIVRADAEGGLLLRRTSPRWGSLTVPPAVQHFLDPGCVAPEAAAIEVPVLIANGERDGSRNPHEEVAAFRRSWDVAMLIVPRMAHMHNFASTRHQLWNHLADWANRVAKLARQD